MKSSDLSHPDRLRILLAGIRKTGITVMYQDTDLTCHLVANAPDHWPPVDEILKHCDDVLFGPEFAERVTFAKRKVLDTGEPTKIEASIQDEGVKHWYALNLEPDHNAEGVVTGLFTTAIDIDDVKYREQVLKTLLRELSHRSKNLLAIIQAIAAQTARSSTSLDGFLVAFRGRIQSLSRSQDLVTASDWRGAGFRELVEGQIGIYAASAHKQITIAGTDPHLFPNTALHLGLALHELVVNAASRGGLADPDGDIRISAQIETSDSGEHMLDIRWEEAFAENGHSHWDGGGFGSVVLERIVPQALSAKAEYGSHPGQVSYRIVIPPSQYSEE